MRPPLVVALLLLVPCCAFAACGDKGGGAEGTGAQSADSATGGGFAGTGAPAAGARPKAQKGITYAPFARYRGRVAIAHHDGFLAVAVGGADGLELRVSKDGQLPQRAKGAGRIPAWAEIHVVPDDHGIAVVTYPRCSGKTAGTCDLYAWSSLDHREKKIEGLSTPGRAEIDGAEVPGAAAGLVLDDPKITDQQLRRGTAKRSGRLLLYQGGSTRTLGRGITREITMGFDSVAELQGRCGERRRLLDLRGREKFHLQSACGFNEGVDGVGVAVEGDHLYFADSKSIGDVVVYDHRIGGRPGNVTRAAFTLPPGETPGLDWAAIDATSGYVTSRSGEWTEITKVTG
ncbi:MAG: hypothetical protein JHD16_19065, partial [Solirubrobacteraceae bacterium]|nr:hypothetical protein [Solirubrobacteraceae bacterium]